MNSNNDLKNLNSDLHDKNTSNNLKIQEIHFLELNDLKNDLLNSNENLMIKNDLNNDMKIKELNLNYKNEINIVRLNLLNENKLKTELIDKVSIIEMNLKLLQNENNDYHYQIDNNNSDNIEIIQKYDDLVINYNDIKNVLDIQIQKYLDIEADCESVLSDNEALKKELNDNTEKYNKMEKLNFELLESKEKYESDLKKFKIELFEKNENFENYKNENENEKNTLFMNINDSNERYIEIEKKCEFLLSDNQDLTNVLQCKEGSFVELQKKFEEKLVEIQGLLNNEEINRNKCDEQKIELEVRIGKTL